MKLEGPNLEVEFEGQGNQIIDVKNLKNIGLDSVFDLLLFEIEQKSEDIFVYNMQFRNN